ncbi:MAG: hypothetical protein H0W74_02590 [Sphingosinicella sp.]|nr:hypothetical protein [Sphingosinicella sp.]
MKQRTGVLVALLLAGCSTAESPALSGGPRLRGARSAPWGPQKLDDMAARLLALHNRERAAVGAAPLVWDPKLAAAAASYGPSLAAIERLEHSAPASRPEQGENLWMGTKGAYSIEAMAGSWAAERSLFRAGIFPDIARTGNWAAVGHYTQMIWPGTTAVGCALHKSGRWDYLICRYAPAGNVRGGRLP